MQARHDAVPLLAQGDTMPSPLPLPRRRPGLRKLRLVALAGGSILVLACALAVFLLRVRRRDGLDWNAALEMTLLAAGLAGTLALA